jgi:hypothetical protein
MSDTTEKLKMIDITISVPEKIGKIIWVLGETGIYSTDEFDELDPPEQMEKMNNIVETFSSLRYRAMVAMMMATVETLHDIVDELYEDEGHGEAIH